MESLTTREHWDAVHVSERAEALKPREATTSRFRRAIKRLLGNRFVDCMSSYDDYQIWEVLYRRHMPRPGASVVEIGSAPGEHLVKLSEIFGLVPLEALLSGTPVIVADDCGCGEVIRAIGGGRVTPLGNVDALAAAIDRTLDAPTYWRTAAAEAAVRVRASYGQEVIGARLDRLYRDVVERAS